MRPNSPETKEIIERLKREIDDLSRKHSQALEMAILVGFSREEKKHTMSNLNESRSSGESCGYLRSQCVALRSLLAIRNET